MRGFFWLVISLVVILALVMWGNSLNCNSRRGVDTCPDVCISQSAQCVPNTEDLADCQTKFDCHAPNLEQYPKIIKSYTDSLKPKK
ncbi:MAG: hypothetical protein UT42_C0016G0010 [Candidatus Falkowbacteria bacterium GW2011_GWA2_39_24]|uniref:Uncharacterized protein n=1 Tax=Candidatus Falkowbacteria bacterium GW2011_GWA2_39_24 TaxID=1618634 RepID=A0A0G0NQ04_9BACT|nr:MAG: hypothetical protein UT42_C0016G0010 [Candidatus Falkowbacteria bacterium GW2011_GWA2_39_24]